MSFDIKDFFFEDSAKLLKHFIEENDGNEIVALGKTDQNGIILSVELVAMGNENTVPAVLKRAKPGEILIHNHPSGAIKPSLADLEVAAQGAEKGVASYIVNNLVTQVFPVVQWIPPQKETEPLNPEEVIEILKKEGKLKEAFSNFEYRKPQLDMALEVTKSFNNETLSAIEAGTGTGKSFAYLIPSMLYTSKNKEAKIVISTSTIALEEQLIEKDIPFLKKALDLDVSVSILKGRSNYLCQRKFANFSQTSYSIFDTKKNERVAVEIEEIKKWMTHQNDGTRSSMNRVVSFDIWNEIHSDKTSCERSKCPFFANCFFYKAVRKANFSSIILVNHHLLMADVSVKKNSDGLGGILPEYDMLIIDEAHNLFSSAMSFLGETFSSNSFEFNFNRLFNASSHRGILNSLLKFTGDGDKATEIQELQRTISGFKTLYKNSLVEEVLEIFKKEDSTTFELSYNQREKLRPIFSSIIDFIAELIKKLNQISKDFQEKIPEDPLERDKDEQLLNSLIVDLNGVIAKFKAYLDFLKLFFYQQEAELEVFWAEKTKQSFNLTITPLNIQEILAKEIYEKKKSIIFTSATLVTSESKKGFEFFKMQSGLNETEKEQTFLKLPGYFDYKKQMKAFILTDIVSPTESNFEEQSKEAVKRLIKSSNGGALVLYTSIKHRNSAFEEIKENLETPLFCQGKLARQILVEKFSNEIHSSLFATDTFWEGVDFKGETLRNLIMVRLPFRFPSHPFVKRYVKILEEKTNLSGFNIYTLPNALLKFRQGIGRLIRTNKDKGAVVILDNRVLSKYYGKYFLRALPKEIKPIFQNLFVVAKEIEEFLN